MGTQITQDVRAINIALVATCPQKLFKKTTFKYLLFNDTKQQCPQGKLRAIMKGYEKPKWRIEVQEN